MLVNDGSSSGGLLGCLDAKPDGERRMCHISGTPCPGECVFALVMQSVSLGIVVLDVGSAQVILCNRAATDLLTAHGVPCEFGTLRALFLPDGTPPRDGEVLSPEPLQLGSRFIGYTAYRSSGFAWVLMRDITEKLRLESIAEAVEVTNNIGHVFSAVRHELGNPLNAVKAALSVLEVNVETCSRESIADYLRRIRGQVLRLEELLRSLKSFSLYERVEVAPVPLDDVLHEFGSLVALDLRRRGIDFEVLPGCTAATLCDRRALFQVLLNVVTNAADAVAAEPEARVTLGAACRGELAVVEVTDNGPGVAAEVRGQLFKPFCTSKSHGTGLGLVIARKLLARMNGTIELRPAEPRGTRVVLTLPMARQWAGEAA